MGTLAGRVLFGSSHTYASIKKHGGNAPKIKKTRITQTVGYDDLLATHRDRIVPLFAINPQGKLQIFMSGRSRDPAAGDRVSNHPPAEPGERPDLFRSATDLSKLGASLSACWPCAAVGPTVLASPARGLDSSRMPSPRSHCRLLRKTRAAVICCLRQTFG